MAKNDVPKLPEGDVQVPAARSEPMDGEAPRLPEEGGLSALHLEGALGLDATRAEEFMQHAFANGVPEVFQPEDDPEAPALPFSTEEPLPKAAVELERAAAHVSVVATLEKWVGPVARPEQARKALVAALAGEQFDGKSLPDNQAMLLGMARVMLAHGIELDDLVAAIMDCMGE